MISRERHLLRFILGGVICSILFLQSGEAQSQCYLFRSTKPFGLRVFEHFRLYFAQGLFSKDGGIGEFHLPFVLVKQDGDNARYQVAVSGDVVPKEKRVLNKVLSLELRKNAKADRVALRLGDKKDGMLLEKIVRQADGRWLHRVSRLPTVFALFDTTDGASDLHSQRFSKTLALVFKGQIRFLNSPDLGSDMIFIDVPFLHLNTVYPYQRTNNQLVLVYAGEAARSETQSCGSGF